MINAADWKNVSRKALSKKVIRFLEKNNVSISNSYARPDLNIVSEFTDAHGAEILEWVND